MAPDDIKKSRLGAIWNFGKEQGCPELILGYGAQRARLLGLSAPGPKVSTPNANQSINGGNNDVTNSSICHDRQWRIIPLSQHYMTCAVRTVRGCQNGGLQGVCGLLDRGAFKINSVYAPKVYNSLNRRDRKIGYQGFWVKLCSYFHTFHVVASVLLTVSFATSVRRKNMPVGDVTGGNNMACLPKSSQRRVLQRANNAGFLVKNTNFTV